MKHQTKIAVTFPSSPDRNGVTDAHLAELIKLGFKVDRKFATTKTDWFFESAPAASRAKALSACLAEDRYDCVFAGRGGYGASDLLPLLPFKKLAGKNLPRLVGFSDISVLHAALWHKSRKQGLHAAMPGSTKWKSSYSEDFSLLLDIVSGKKSSWSLAVTPLGKVASLPVKKIFGGNLAALTQLIGTPYMQKSFAHQILFFEDLSENAGRVVRYFNQWSQAGYLKNVAGIILGDFLDLGGNFTDSDARFYAEMSARLAPIPCFKSKDFGHGERNLPIPVGGFAKIVRNKLTVSFAKEFLRHDDKRS